MKIAACTVDGGDGSCSVRWFKEDQFDYMEELLEDYEPFYGNEGSPAIVLTLPDDIDLMAIGFNKFSFWEREKD